MLTIKQRYITRHFINPQFSINYEQCRTLVICDLSTGTSKIDRFCNITITICQLVFCGQHIRFFSCLICPDWQILLYKKSLRFSFSPSVFFGGYHNPSSTFASSDSVWRASLAYRSSSSLFFRRTSASSIWKKE